MCRAFLPYFGFSDLFCAVIILVLYVCNYPMCLSLVMDSAPLSRLKYVPHQRARGLILNLSERER